ncbi:hypothetical protein N2152v2_004980 [Parachlorella kessleri]
MRWVNLEQKGTPPVARSSHTITAVGDKLVLWGGEHTPRVPIDSQVHVYDVAVSTWSQPAATGDVPAPRNAPAAAAIGSKVYYFGGRSGIDMGEGSLDELYAFDVATNRWSKVEPRGGVCPPRRSYHAMVSQGGKLYVFGGCGEAGRLNDLWEFDTASGTWSQLPTSAAIKGRGGCGFAAAAGALYVIGGFCGNELNDVHRFDLSTRQWDCGAASSTTTTTAASAGAGSGATTAAGAAAASGGAAPAACGCRGTSSALPARSVFAQATHGCRQACPHGGHVVVFAAGDFSNDAFCFDSEQPVDSWHKLQPEGDVPCPRGWLAATATPAGVVIFGGNSNSNERLGDMYLLDMHS